MAVSSDLSTDERVHRTAWALHGAGCPVRIIGRERKASAPLEVRPYAQQRLPMWFDSGPLFYAELNIRLVLELLFIRQTVLVAHDMDTMPAMALLAWLYRLPLVFDAHEYFSQVPELQAKPRVRRFWVWLEGWLIPRADVCYTVGQALAERFTQLYGKPFGAVMNLPAKQIAPANTTGRRPRHVVYVGALNKGRGIGALLEALQQLPDYTAVLVGYGDEELELQKLARNLGLNGRVEFTGKLTRAEYLPLLATASVGYSLLEPLGLSYYYSLSNKFFEYMAAGLPQLYPNLPEYDRIAGNRLIGAALPAEPEAIVEALLKVEDRILWEEMAANALALSQNFSWEQEEQKLLALYQEVLQ